jgi:hypothetical protein
MSELTIKTNNHYRPLLYGFELTEKEQKEYDFLDFTEDGEGFWGRFFRYKHWTYLLDDFMRIDANSPFPEKWHGYHSDSFFSGIVIQLSDDGEAVVAGTYYS